MFRLLPLLAFVFVPALLVPSSGELVRPGAPTFPVAAPVPRDAGRPSFGTNGLLTRADLEKVTFDSKAVDDGRAGDPASFKIFTDRLRASGDLAVHMPWTTFREGSAIPVYFVAKNALDSPSDFSSVLYLFPPQRSALNDFRICVRNRATGETDGIERGGCMLGGGPRVLVPAKGFYVVGTDFGLKYGKPRPPGEYEVSWSHWSLHSAPVRFTVTQADGEKPQAPVTRSDAWFYLVSSEPAHQRTPNKAGESFVWDKCYLESLSGDEVASALAVGHEGVFVPDINTIPPSDHLVDVVAEWKPHRDGDRVAATVRAVHPSRPVRFSEVPRVYLQLDSWGAHLHENWPEEDAPKITRPTPEVLTTPLTIEARLPPNWREQSRLTGAHRCAILVTSKPIKMPREAWNPQRREKELPLPVEPHPRLWSGVVRTAFTELQFPPAPPARAP